MDILILTLSALSFGAGYFLASAKWHEKAAEKSGRRVACLRAVRRQIDEGYMKEGPVIVRSKVKPWRVHISHETSYEDSPLSEDIWHN